VRGSTDLVRRLAAQRAATDLAGSALDQVVGIELFTRLDEIVEGRRAELRPRRDALLAALAAQLPEWQVPVPAGGLSVWAELDAPLATPLTVAAAQYGVILVSGSRFGIDGTLERFLRLPFSLPILLDSDGDAASNWTPRVFPTTILIGRDGLPRQSVIGELDWMDGTARELVEPLLVRAKTA